MFRGRWGHGQWVGLLGLPSAGRRDPVGSSRGECPLLEGPRPAAAAPPKPTSSRAPGRAGPSVPPLPATGRAGHTLAQQGGSQSPRHRNRSPGEACAGPGAWAWLQTAGALRGAWVGSQDSRPATHSPSGAAQWAVCPPSTQHSLVEAGISTTHQPGRARGPG